MPQTDIEAHTNACLDAQSQVSTRGHKSSVAEPSSDEEAGTVGSEVGSNDRDFEPQLGGEDEDSDGVPLSPPTNFMPATAHSARRRGSARAE